MGTQRTRCPDTRFNGKVKWFKKTKIKKSTFARTALIAVLQLSSAHPSGFYGKRQDTKVFPRTKPAATGAASRRAGCPLTQPQPPLPTAAGAPCQPASAACFSPLHRRGANRSRFISPGRAVPAASRRHPGAAAAGPRCPVRGDPGPAQALGRPGGVWQGGFQDCPLLLLLGGSPSGSFCLCASRARAGLRQGAGRGAEISS